jgi:hypothetical protein
LSSERPHAIAANVRPHLSEHETEMKLKIDNKDYEMIIASDVNRDGIGLEIFRADTDQRIDFYSEKINVPLELIEKSLEIFNQRIGKEFQK